MIDPLIFYIPLAYLIGSVPTAVWLGRFLFRKDIREHGSGNAGATNTFRTFGRKAGAFVLLIDVLKGVLAVNLAFLGARTFNLPYPSVGFSDHYELLLGLAAAAGHILPVFAGFRGGKAVATLFGVVIGLDYRIALICLAVFALEFLIFRWVSLGSMVAALAFTIAFIVLNHPYKIFDNVIVHLYPVLIFITHRENIRRLLTGKEPRFSFKRAKPT